jgi:hypothetical protein
MPFVAGVRWAFRGKDAGRADSQSYRRNRGRSIGAPSAARGHNLYFANPSYQVANSTLTSSATFSAPNSVE